MRINTGLLWLSILALPLSAFAQRPQQLVQHVVDTERAANQNDHSHWMYLDESHKPKQQSLQWVASTPQGDLDRVLVQNGRPLSEAEQRNQIQTFEHDVGAQKKQIEENKHDAQQIDDLLKLLPAAFLWTRIGGAGSTTSLHFEPNPAFHPPTREARVFASMSGDLVADNEQHRIHNMNGRLIHDVTFGGGLLGRLKQGSSFALAQEQVGPSLWQLTQVNVHLDGNALLFKSVSLQQEEKRSHFTEEPPNITLDQASAAVMHQPEVNQSQQSAISNLR